MTKSAKEINDEAVELLFSYRLPVIREVLDELPPPRIPGYRTLDRTRLERETGEALDGVHPSARIDIKDLTPQLDNLQETGIQHVMLLRFVGDLPEFGKLRMTKEISDRLERQGLSDRLNQPHYLDINNIPDAPLLVEVRHRAGRLVCKWVERRVWRELVEITPDNYRRQAREARAVNFFDLDLVTGAAEVKIQGLRTRALTDREDKLNEFLSLAIKTLGIEGFEPLPLSPAIRHLLADPEIETTKVRVVPDGGGFWEGKEDDVCPVPLDRLKAATMFEGKWRADANRKIRIGLDALISELRILNACSPEHYQSLLEHAREWAGELPQPLVIPEIAPPITETETAGPTTKPETTPLPVQTEPAPTPTSTGTETGPATPPPSKTKPPPQPIVVIPPVWIDPTPPDTPEPLWTRLRRIVKESKVPGIVTPSEEGETIKKVREFVAVENEKAAAGVGRPRKGSRGGGDVDERRRRSARATWASKEAVETFLNHIRKSLHDEIRLYQKQLTKLAADERLVFRLSITSIAIALLFALIGSGLIVFGRLTFGVLAEVVGLVSGTIWALIMQLKKQLKERQAQLEAMQSERIKLLPAVEASLAVGTWEAMQEVADRLWVLATASVPKP